MNFFLLTFYFPATIGSFTFEVIGGSLRACWDIEYEELFASYGIKPRSRSSMYTTVHYVIRANQKTNVTCEVQVRTLMDEVWGEVSHRVNYPVESTNTSCKDQLKILARITTGGTRLVDSIFRSAQESNSPRYHSGRGVTFRSLLDKLLRFFF